MLLFIDVSQFVSVSSVFSIRFVSPHPPHIIIFLFFLRLIVVNLYIVFTRRSPSLSVYRLLRLFVLSFIPLLLIVAFSLIYFYRDSYGLFLAGAGVHCI